MTGSDIGQRCAAQLPAGFLEDDEPVFHEPWQAQVFALAVALVDSGCFSWDEWARTLGEEISLAAENGIAGDGSGYYQLWLRAVERLATSKELTHSAELADLKQQWWQAYHDTPHGQPVRIT